MTRPEINDFYQERVTTLTTQLHRLQRRNRWFVVSELLSFILVIGCLVAFTSWMKHSVMLLLALLLFGVYLMIRRFDGRNGLKIEQLTNSRSVYEKELQYMAGNFSVFENGEKYVDATHPYTFDMDIFGSESLFQRINRTVTTGGADQLAAELSTVERSNKASIERRQQVIAELAEHETLRNAFLAMGQPNRVDTDKVKAALQQMKQLQISSFVLSPLSLVVAIGALLTFYTLIVLAVCGKVPVTGAIWWGIAHFAILYMGFSHPLSSIGKCVNNVHKQLKQYANMMQLIAQSQLQSAEGLEMIGALTAGDAHAVRLFERLEHILDRLDSRSNLLGMMLFNVFLLSDFFLLRRFLQWQHHFMQHVGQWIEVVNRFDALVSMATFRYNEPSARNAEIVSTNGEVVYRAKGISHPFLGEQAVKNDFTLENHNYYIITGANMAGKSTFLRALGVNYILAMNGMPVFADRLEVSLFSLFSSMRTTDDLAHGISYFNAELLRLEQLMVHCRQKAATLIILDEILKGTNSLDKLNGSRFFLEKIAALPVTGVVATHDLELSKMADECPNRFHNYCFEIELANDITYTYKVTAGVARNQNATFLLRHIIERAEGDTTASGE